MIRRRALLLVVLLAMLPACGNAAPRWQALVLPAAVLAAKNGEPEPLVLRTLRLTLPDGTRRVQFSDEDEPALVNPGETLAMRFTASEPFRGAGLLVAAVGGETRVVLRLLEDTAGRPIAEQAFENIEDRRWLDLEVAEGRPGPYRLELRVERGRAGWWSQRLADSTGSPAGFAATGAPLVHNAALTVPVNARAERIAILGGVSSYDHGIGWWRDYEVQGDTGDRQFVGDEAGAIEVRYSSGAVDRAPLVYGWTLWWRTHLTSDRWGGPFPQPFDDPTAQAARAAALRLAPTEHPLAPFQWQIVPRREAIESIAIVDSPAKQGVPGHRRDLDPVARPAGERGPARARDRRQRRGR
ncbi:MAG: hypothetical protein KatS3mg060_3512 [Dehalococcoidia bacterium]|nr:MAG: hypothetical protein KatS3mg060_3512 [Dehalococcoidia bacterium]